MISLLNTIEIKGLRVMWNNRTCTEKCGVLVEKLGNCLLRRRLDHGFQPVDRNGIEFFLQKCIRIFFPLSELKYHDARDTQKSFGKKRSLKLKLTVYV